MTTTHVHTAVLTGEVDTDTHRVACLVRRVAVAATHPYLIILCFDDTATIHAIIDTLDAAAWTHGITGALDAMAAIIADNGERHSDVYGYALVVPDHAVAYITDRYGGRDSVPLGPVCARHPDTRAAADTRLGAMLASGAGLYEQEQPREPMVLLVGLTADQSGTLAETAADTGLRIHHADTPAAARPLWPHATLVVTTTPTLLTCAAANLPDHPNLVVLAEQAHPVLPPAGTGGHLTLWPTHQTWLAERLAGLAQA